MDCEGVINMYFQSFDFLMAWIEVGYRSIMERTLGL